jgi:pimeloyl-ACP methyl ester carboxylesterase
MGRWAGVLLAGLIALPAAAQGSPGPRGGGWVSFDLEAGGRRLRAAEPMGQTLSATGQPPTDPAARRVLTVVIEGDGEAHDRNGRARPDPTPRRPTGYEIARAWPDGPRAWLGRLCQHQIGRDAGCTPADWTDGRFSPSAIAATNLAIDQLKARAGAGQVRLVGWSGGGTLATLAAAERGDVATLITLAAPLDLAGWTRGLGLTPLGASRDPADLPAMPQIPQIHLLGRHDPVVPPALVEATGRRLGGPRAVVETWPMRHACCWASRARDISRLADSVLVGPVMGDASDKPAAAP